MGSTRSQRPSRARRVALAAGAALVLAGTAGCSADTEWGRLGYPEPATEQGPLLLAFWQNAWIAAFAVGVLTWGLIFWAIIAYRKRANSGAPVQTRYNAPLREKYQKLIGSGKAAKIAITAIMRKLIVLANALLRQNRKWTPNAPC